jgi:hypothetical protein
MIGRTPILGKELVMCWIFLFNLSRFHPARGALRSGLVAPEAVRLIVALRAA